MAERQWMSVLCAMGAVVCSRLLAGAECRDVSARQRQGTPRMAGIEVTWRY